jgi:hypothetical protein
VAAKHLAGWFSPIVKPSHSHERCRAEESRLGCVDKAIVATVNVRMFLVTRDQQENMLVAISIHSKACDLPTIVDSLRVHQIDRGAGRN